MRYYAVADVHLSQQSVGIRDAFISALTWIDAQQPTGLLLLGDLFDFWLGDDARAQHDLEPVLAQISALNCSKFFFPGNRDFLVGSQLGRALNWRTIEKPWVLTHAQHRTLLLHGDQFCPAYRPAQTLLRTEQWREQFLHQSIPARQAQFDTWRATHPQHSRARTDLDLEALNALASTRKATGIVHGHTHAPHSHCASAATLPRWVLGDWDEQGGVVAELNHSGVQLLRFSRSSGVTAFANENLAPTAPAPRVPAH